MFAVLGNRNFALLWLGQLVSNCGDLLLLIALPFYVYRLTSSVLQTGAMFIVESLPRIALGSLAGVFVDRWNRSWTMIIADLLRAGFLLLLLTLHDAQMLWLVYVVAAIQSILAQFFRPAYSAITPSLVTEEQLTAANSLSAFSDALTLLVGPLLGGALLGLLGLGTVVLSDSLSFLFSALMVALIFLPARQQIVEGQSSTPESAVDALVDGSPANTIQADSPGERAEEAQTEKQGLAQAFWMVWREWLAGLSLVRQARVLLALFLTMGGTMAIAQGIFNVVLVVFVKVVLHGDALMYGDLIAMQGIGTLVGALLVNTVSKLLKPAYLMGGSLLLSGVGILFFVNFPSLRLGLILIPLVGALIVGFYVNAQTLLQTQVADEYRGRIFGALGTTTAALALIGMASASLLGDLLGPVLLLSVAGSLMCLSGLISGLMLLDPPVGKPQETEKASSAIDRQ